MFLQRTEMTMIRWKRGVIVRDKFTCNEQRQRSETDSTIVFENLRCISFQEKIRKMC